MVTGSDVSWNQSCEDDEGSPQGEAEKGVPPKKLHPRSWWFPIITIIVECLVGTPINGQIPMMSLWLLNFRIAS